jgi:hypothetical protein
MFRDCKYPQIRKFNKINPISNPGNLLHNYGSGQIRSKGEVIEVESPLTEPVFVNVYGAQESIPRNRFCQQM